MKKIKRRFGKARFSREQATQAFCRQRVDKDRWKMAKDDTKKRWWVFVLKG